MEGNKKMQARGQTCALYILKRTVMNKLNVTDIPLKTIFRKQMIFISCYL